MGEADRIAYHEAGHATVAVIVGGWTPTRIEVTAAGGVTHYSQGNVGNPLRRRREALVLLGGPVAEYITVSGARFHPVAFHAMRSVLADEQGEGHDHDLTRVAALYHSATWDEVQLFRRNHLLNRAADLLMRPIAWDAVEELAGAIRNLGEVSSERMRYWLEARPELARALVADCGPTLNTVTRPQPAPHNQHPPSRSPGVPGASSV